MLDLNKLNTKTKMEIILIWLEMLSEKDHLSINDKKMISDISNYILEEMNK